MHSDHYVFDRSRAGQSVVTFHYSTDLDGGVHIVTRSKQGETREVIVPGFVLVDFLAARIAEQRIGQLEEKPRTVLGVPDNWPCRWGNGREPDDIDKNLTFEPDVWAQWTRHSLATGHTDFDSDGPGTIFCNECPLDADNCHVAFFSETVDDDDGARAPVVLHHDPDDPLGCSECPLFFGVPRDGVCRGLNNATLHIHGGRFKPDPECPLREGGAIITAPEES